MPTLQFEPFTDGASAVGYSEQLIASAFRRKLESIDLDTCSAGSEDSFFVCDIGTVYNQYLRWRAHLPRIEPFYAVKCNPDPKVLDLFVGLGMGFDCASKYEIEMVSNLGVSPDRIVYANPCKTPSYVRFAESKGVRLMTFDNSDELRKIAKLYPGAHLLLRIATDDTAALCQLSVKFGAALSSVKPLLQLARDLGLNIVGTAFHVGSGAEDPGSFSTAVKDARMVFDEGIKLGFDMKLLDVGGGFSSDSFEICAAELREYVDKLFPSDVRVIAEPGRFFVSKAFSLAAHVIARREVLEAKPKIYLNDGIYGNLNCILFDHQAPIPRVLKHDNRMYTYSIHSTEDKEVSVWGPTCDGLDCIAESCYMPVDLQAGDWVFFDHLGAYSSCASTTFNGFNTSCEVIYVDSREEEPLSCKTVENN